MKRLRNFAERHPIGVAAGVGATATLGLILRLLLPTPVGLSDQGDGHRLLCQLGLRTDIPWGAPNAFARFSWLDYQFVGETCGANGTGEPYYSSQLLLLRVAGWLTGVFMPPGGLDLRVLGVVCALIAGFAVAWLVAELRGPVLGRVVVGLVVAAVVADPGFADYFASPYSEPASFLGVLLLCPALVRLFRERERTWLTLVITAVIAAFALTSKTQMISILPGLLIALLLRPGPGAELVADREAPRAKRFHAAVRRRAVAVILAVGVAGVSLAYLAAQPKRFSEANMYSQVFLTMLPNSPDPAADLRWFGLDPQLASASGENILSPKSAAVLPAYADFTEKVTPAKIGLFYLVHPERVPHLGFAGLNGAVQFRPPPTYLANYSAESGQPPNTAEHRLESVTTLYKLYASAPGLLALHWLVALIVFAIAAYRRSPVGWVGLLLMTAIFCQFWVVMLSEGMADLIKHMVVVNFLTALTVPLGIALWVGRRRPGREQPVPDTRPAQPELVAQPVA